MMSFIGYVLMLIGAWVVFKHALRLYSIFVGESEMRWRRVRDWWRSLFEPPPKPLEMPDIPKPKEEPEVVDFTPYRTQHMHIIGGSGAGKTTLLEHRIFQDLQDQSEVSVVVIDSQTEMIQKLSHLAAFSDDHHDHRYLNQRVILIDPRDQPAMNPFAIDRKRLEKYDEHTRYQIEQGIIQTFDYLFASVLGAEFTTRQSTLFHNTARLMVSLPQTMGRNATLVDLLHFMQNPDPYIPVIETLSPLAQEYFKATFFDRETSRASKGTREQVAARLYALLEDPVLAKILGAETNELDLFNRLNNGYIFLVDTAREYLHDASTVFGSFFICNLMQAIQERAAPKSGRNRCHVYIDEAQEYFKEADDMIEGLLTQARKQNVGLCFAHHNKGQCTPKLWSSFMANTAIKLASGISAEDAGAISRDYRCEPKDLLQMPQYSWACFVKGMESRPFLLKEGPSPLGREMRMSEYEYREFRSMNQLRVTRQRAQDEERTPPVRNEPVTARKVAETVSPPNADPVEAATEWRPPVD